MNLDLLQKLQEIYAPAGEEEQLKDYLLSYIKKNKKDWKVQPEVFHGKEFQNCIVLVFGKPTTAIFAHMDSIGYTVKYQNELIKLGGTCQIDGIDLFGYDSQGKIEGKLKVEKRTNKLSIDFPRTIEPGTNLVYQSNWKETKNYVRNCYMDNRLGVWNALEVAKTLKNGALVFSCWEETGGGSIGYLAKFLYEKYQVQQALISDITWVTEGVKAGEGCVISQRDSGIPRRSYIKRIMQIADENGIAFQREVEGAGGSDGNQLQKSDFPFDWCFVGAPEQNVHTPKEKVHKEDIKSMVKLYKCLMKNL
ncbi:MAG: M20/M25/M40 family metallo-hydrolase [Flavobacteriales bacterium]|jgi:putative aminopeptidase FrvX|nr:M20/M25/M40 family metallo-hydrolase [Flavobacteriales bacterium]